MPPGERDDHPPCRPWRGATPTSPCGASSATARSTSCCPSPRFHWPHWFWCDCRVRGHVIKVETLGGVTYEKPVCHARVHICEVDRLPWIIAQLPDDIILRLRDELLEAIRWPIPIPDPPGPWPDFDPGYIDPVPVLAQAVNVFGRFDEVMLNPQPLPPRLAASRMSRLNIRAFDPQPEPPRVQMAELPFEVHGALRSPSADDPARDADQARRPDPDLLVRLGLAVAVVPLPVRRAGRDRDRRERRLRHHHPVPVLRRPPRPVLLGGVLDRRGLGDRVPPVAALPHLLGLRVRDGRDHPRDRPARARLRRPARVAGQEDRDQDHRPSGEHGRDLPRLAGPGREGEGRPGARGLDPRRQAVAVRRHAGAARGLRQRPGGGRHHALPLVVPSARQRRRGRLAGDRRAGLAALPGGDGPWRPGGLQVRADRARHHGARAITPSSIRSCPPAARTGKCWTRDSTSPAPTSSPARWRPASTS